MTDRITRLLDAFHEGDPAAITDEMLLDALDEIFAKRRDVARERSLVETCDSCGRPGVLIVCSCGCGVKAHRECAF